MLKSSELSKGTLLEATGSACELFVNDDEDFTTQLPGNGQPAAAGKLFMVERVTSSPITVFLSEVGGPLKGHNFLVWISGAFKIHSQPAAASTETFSPREPKLNANEEFVLVSKANPDLVFRCIDDTSRTHDKNDSVVGNLTFNSKSGQRKKFKTMQTLTGFLHNASGLLDPSPWHFHFKKHPDKAREFHLHALDQLPDWVGGPKVDQDFDKLELRKYDRDSRKISLAFVDFDLSGYLAKFKEVFNLTFLYGEAVSGLAAKLAEDQALDAFPFVFCTEFDSSKFKYRHESPREKDLYADLAIKQLGLKKREVPSVNKNGFAAVGCSSLAQAEALSKAYKNDGSKSVSILQWARLDSSADLARLTDYFGGTPAPSASIAPASPSSKAPKP